MSADETLARETVRRVLTVARPDRIILGSAATGQMTKDSDIDLLIVEPAPKDHDEGSMVIEAAIGDVNFPIDVKIIASERFEATKNIIGGIAYPPTSTAKSSIRPPEDEIRRLVGDWIAKADLDFDTVVSI